MPEKDASGKCISNSQAHWSGGPSVHGRLVLDCVAGSAVCFSFTRHGGLVQESNL